MIFRHVRLIKLKKKLKRNKLRQLFQILKMRL